MIASMLDDLKYNRYKVGPVTSYKWAVRAPTRFWHLQCKSYYQYFDDLFGRLNLDGGQGQDDDTDEMSCNICGTGMYR